MQTNSDLVSGEIKPAQPLPWKRDQYGTVLDASGERVVLTGFSLSSGRQSDEAITNTDFVFRAANAHADLVTALELALFHGEGLVGDEWWTYEDLVIIRAALAKATAK